MKQIYKIKPKNGLNLRFPGMNRFLNPEGELVEWSSFWQRRLKQGDIEIISNLAEEKKFIESAESVESVDDSDSKKESKKKSKQGVES